MGLGVFGGVKTIHLRCKAVDVLFVCFCFLGVGLDIKLTRFSNLVLVLLVGRETLRHILNED